MSKRAGLNLVALILASIVLAGCPKPPPVAQAGPEPKPTPPPVIDTKVDAGVPVSASNDVGRWQNLIAAAKIKPRKDPFQLSDIERGFEFRQEAERLVQLQGGFSVAFEAVPEKQEPAPVVEPQPADRRLAGVLVGDSVLAIIEMGNGRPAEIVRPGQKIAGTAWTVVSIDPDKAVLHRGGNVLPHEVTVRLQSRLGAAAPRSTPSQPFAPSAPSGVPPSGRSGGGRFGGG